MTIRLTILMFVPLALVICAPATSPGFDDAPANQTVRRDRSAAVERMRKLAATVSVQVERKPRPVAAALVEPAILAYSDPGGFTTDGSVWAFGKTGRPVAVAGIFFHELAQGGEKWSCELLSFSEEPLVAKTAAPWKWTPAKTELKWNPVPESPVPGETKPARLRQMKEIARRFQVSEKLPEKTGDDQLRLLERELHRYADPDRDVIDGALFSFSNGTNPEALLLVECRKAGDAPAAWHFGFARMAASAVTARLGETTVWTCRPIDVWKATEPYFSMFGPERTVFGDRTSTD